MEALKIIKLAKDPKYYNKFHDAKKIMPDYLCLIHAAVY